MGWDAFAVPFKSKIDDDPDPDFIPAAARLVGQGIIIDGLLKYGGLDHSGCGEALELATGLSVYGDPWSPELVKVLARKADWNFSMNDERNLYKESARAFLEACAKAGRGIRFSF